MSHLDDESLAAVATGDGSDAERAHVDSCTECAARRDGLTAVASALRSSRPLADLDAPPERVWAAISAELGLTGADAGQGEPREAVLPVSLAGARATKAQRGASDTHQERANRMDVGAPPRGGAHPWRYLTAAASIAAIALVGAFAFGLFREGDEATMLASAPLEDLAKGTAAGDATVEKLADGTTVLVIDTDYESPGDGALEVWLIDPEIKGMISVGYLSSDHGEFVLPPGFDLAGHPIVDISVEPHDGVPTHSGVSVTRGVLNI